jgi:hypothetical protein
MTPSAGNLHVIGTCQTARLRTTFTRAEPILAVNRTRAVSLAALFARERNRLPPDPRFLAVLAMPSPTLGRPVPVRSHAADAGEPHAPPFSFLHAVLGGVMGRMIGGRQTFQVRGVVVERIAVAVVDFAAFGDRPVHVLPYLLMKSSDARFSLAMTGDEIGPVGTAASFGIAAELDTLEDDDMDGTRHEMDLL